MNSPLEALLMGFCKMNDTAAPTIDAALRTNTTLKVFAAPWVDFSDTALTMFIETLTSVNK